MKALQYTPLEAIIACAEVLRREDRNIDVNRVAALMLDIYQRAYDNGEDPSYVAQRGAGPSQVLFPSSQQNHQQSRVLGIGIQERQEAPEIW
jgi:hypothetical protein